MVMGFLTFFFYFILWIFSGGLVCKTGIAGDFLTYLPGQVDLEYMGRELIFVHKDVQPILADASKYPLPDYILVGGNEVDNVITERIITQKVDELSVVSIQTKDIKYIHGDPFIFKGYTLSDKWRILCFIFLFGFFGVVFLLFIKKG